MALARELHEGWTRASVLRGPLDLVPERAVRFLKNGRVDRDTGAITSRPGMSQETGTDLGSTVLALHKRYATAGDTTYAHHSSTVLSRMTSTWDSPATIATVTATPVSGANMVDGEGTVWAYFVNGAVIGKDNGTTLRTAGIAAPTNPPTAVALAADLTTTINAMDAAASWTGAGLSAGPADETNIRIEGTGSVTFTVAAGSLGSIGIGSLGGGTGFINLDTLSGGDATVKADDYIHLWVRCDRPDRVDYLQLDFDLDTQTLASAFRTNYYSIHLPGFSRLNQGRDQWTKIQVRKSEFQRFGTSTAVSWATVKSARISLMTTADGAVVCYVDDFKLRGGTDIEGEVEYTVAYRNDVTGGRGNPPLDADGHVEYTTALTVDRQRVSLTTTNVIEGGGDHPGDTQIDRIILYRRIDQGNSVNIAEFADTTASPYVDSVSVFGSVLNEVLEDTPDFPGSEAENDLPPAGHVVFGPGALNRLFMLVGDNRLYYSKAWQRNENRAENWPPLNFATIGDGSERALAGLVSDISIFVWTTRQTFQVLGSGAETFLPVPVPNSRGIVNRYAVTEGDGFIFFFAPDGLYQQSGLQQVRVVDIGETLQEANINLDTTALSTIRLAWHADTHAPFVCVLIPSGSSALSARLIVKKNSQTGRYDDVILDTTTGLNVTAVLSDAGANRLYGGASDGHVYRLEDHTVETDNGTGLAWEVLTGAHHQGQPHRDKQYAQVSVEAQTQGQNVTATILYDKGATSEALGTLSTTTAVGDARVALDEPLALHQDYALRLTATTTSRVTLYRYGVHYEVQPEAVLFLDTGVLILPFVDVLKRFDLDIHAPATVTLQPYYDDGIGTALTVLPTSGRAFQRVWCPPNILTRLVRVTLTSTSPFRLYGLRVRRKQLGAVIGYTPTSLLQEVR